MNTIGFGKQRLIKEIIKQAWHTDDVSNLKFSVKDLMFIIQEMGDNEGRRYLENLGDRRQSFNVFEQFAKHLISRNLANYDTMILTCANKGAGKSSFAILLARAWCKILGFRFDPKIHIAYNNSDIMERLDNLPKWHPLIMDEGVRFASSADWNLKSSKRLRKRLAEVRTKHHLMILCFPLKVTKVEKSFLDSFTSYWTQIIDRGVAALFIRDRNPAHDPWRINDFKNVGSYTQFTKVTDIEKKLKKHPNFWKIVKFPKPPKWLYEKYLEVRESNVYDEQTVREMITTEDVHKALLLMALQDIMMNDATLNLNRISLHIKNQYDIPITKSHIQNIMSDSKQIVTKIRGEQLGYKK